MRAVIQRVSKASVEVDGQITGQIATGLLVYLGVADGDGAGEVEFIARKIAELRIFEDDAGKMNRSVVDVGGAVLIISNFTVCGNCRKGRRPSFDNAAALEPAQKLYENVAEAIAAFGIGVEKGVFQAHMRVESVNAGPVNFIIESP